MMIFEPDNRCSNSSLLSCNSVLNQISDFVLQISSVLSYIPCVQTATFCIYNKLLVCATYDFLNLAVLLILSLISS